HLHQRHCGIMLADDLAVDLPQIVAAREVFVLVDDIPGHADNMLGAGARLCKYTNDVPEALPGLIGEVVALESRFGIPANLAGNENHASLRGDAVRIAFGSGPFGGIECLHDGSAKLL